MNCHCNNQETNATIQNMEKACSAWAVIPSYTVATMDNLKGLRNAFVHVSSVNTTFYIDNQLRRIITWKGPVFQDNYDYENNPLKLVDQIVYDGANNRIIIFNQTGNYQLISTNTEAPVPSDNEERIVKLESEMAGVQHDIENLTELTESIPTDVVTSIDLTESNGGLQVSTHTRNTTSGTNTDSTLEPVLQPLLVSGTNIKTINGESILGEGDIEIASEGSTDFLAQYTLSSPNLGQLWYPLPTADAIIIRGNVIEKGDAESGNSVALSAITAATTTQAGVMTAADKTKLDGLSASTNLSSIPTAAYTADNVNLSFGDEVVELTPAVGTAGGAVSKAGIMSAFQASQLAALAEAYKAEEKGTTLYEGTASVNNIELSESGFTYDHLIVVAHYMGMGSAALEQQVSVTFYPSENVKAFQMNAIDLTVGDTPMETTYQDIWMITDDGMELELGPSIKCDKGAGTLTCTPESTSFFTITKVVGFGKKAI